MHPTPAPKGPFYLGGEYKPSLQQSSGTALLLPSFSPSVNLAVLPALSVTVAAAGTAPQPAAAAAQPAGVRRQAEGEVQVSKNARSTTLRRSKTVEFVFYWDDDNRGSSLGQNGDYTGVPQPAVGRCGALYWGAALNCKNQE